MKRFLLLICLFFACHTRAAEPVQPVTLSFEKITVVQFLSLVYGDILKTNYALDPDLVDFPKTVTVHIQSGFDKPKLTAFVSDLLASVGVVVEQKNGYVFVRPIRETVDKPDIDAPMELFFYRAKYRPVSMLIDLTASLFKTGHFSSQRQQKMQPPASSAITSVAGATVQNPKNTKDQKQKQPTESTTSAYSLLDKNDNDVFIFQGTESEIATLQKLLVQIDTVVPQVVVKGTVYEVQTGHKDGSAFSLAMSVLGNNLAATVGQIIKGDSLTLRAGNIDAVFSALSTDNRFKSISNTSLRVSSGSSARFSVGSDVPVLGAVQTDRNGAAVQSVEYKPSGVIFDLKPTIRDAVIDLAISQQLSSFVTTTTGVNNSPTLIKREISTNVGAVDGDVIVLGGLDDDQTTDDAAGLAFMPPWARSKATEGKKTQILLVLQVQKI